VEYPVKADRRAFLRRGAMGAGAMWMLSLQELAARSGHRGPVVINGISPYGPIGPKKDEATGLELLKLPDGFRYWSYSWTGDEMSDGVLCPNLHDGRAVVDDWRSTDNEPGADQDDVKSWSAEPLRFDDKRRGDDDRRPRSGKIVLVRNHEGDAGQPYVAGRSDITYSPTGMSTGSGGTTNLVFDTKRGKWVASWSSLAGTVRRRASGCRSARMPPATISQKGSGSSG
jgi:hypothetical protein